MDMYGYVWICMDMYGYVWICMDIYIYIWIYLDIYDQQQLVFFLCPGLAMSKSAMNVPNKKGTTDALDEHIRRRAVLMIYVLHMQDMFILILAMV
jgi:hypothetical protein